MMFRVTIIAAALVGIPSFASAQTLQRALVKADPQHGSVKNVHVTLEMRWLGLNDNFMERIGGSDLKKMELPKMGSHAIYDQQTADLLLQWANGDKRSSVDHIPTFTVPSGERCEFTPYKPNQEVQGNDTIQATVSDDRQAIYIHLTWAKLKDGKERMPEITAEVPVGSHLLLLTAEKLGMPLITFSPSYWEQVKSRLFNWKPKALGWENQPVFLMVSPHIASEEIANVW
jgi:hypothetical protein